MIGRAVRWVRDDRRRVGDALAVALLVALVVPFVVFAVPATVGADHSYVVLSSSMAPAIGSGDVVLVAETDAHKIERGDVIAFEPPAGSDRAGVDRVTHRVVEVVRENGRRLFRTKGDANEDPDPKLVPPENVIGHVTLVVPLLGHVVAFLGTDLGVLALVVVPATLLVAGELWDLARAAGPVGGDREDEDS